MKNPLRWFVPTGSRPRGQLTFDGAFGADEQPVSAGSRAQPQPDTQANQQKMATGLGDSPYAWMTQPHARWTRSDYASMAQTGFMQNPIVHRCVRLIADNTASLPLRLATKDQIWETHPALDLISRPNASQAGRSFFETLVGHLLVSGNAYIHGLETSEGPAELHLLRPDRVSVITDRDGWVQAYEHRVGGRKEKLSVDADGRSPVLHLTQFHPLDDVQGFPPLRAALMALDIHNAASRWNKGLLDNSARPSGALVYETREGANLTEDQFARLRSELDEGYSGASRAGRPLLLEGGLDWKAMGYSPRDMDFVSARNAAARDIALTFGVPPMLLGIPGDNTYSNYKEANRAFMRQTVLPLAGKIIDGLNLWLLPRFEADLAFSINLEDVDALTPERDALWQRVMSADFLTVEEKRRMVGLPPNASSLQEDKEP